MTQAKPTLDRKAAEQINLNVLKRLDPAIEELLATAGHVALYDFDVPTRRWARKDVEGSLFLVKRRGSPRFQIIILNKKSADNYVEDVGGGFQAELNPPYLLYRNKSGEVVGIWFYEESDCKRMADLISRISATFAAPSDAEAGASGAASAPTSPAYQEPAPPAAVVNGGGDEEEEDEGVFWDKRVEVPKELAAPGSAPVPAPAPPAKPSNALVGLFAGLKVKVAGQTPPAPAASSSSASAMPLLTPQFLQASAAPAASAPAAPPAPAAPAENQGALLLQSLQARSSGNVAPAGEGGADKAASLLRALAANETFCGELAKELQRAGWSMA